MGKESTCHMVQRAVSICQCGTCLTCVMADRLLGQLEEINNLHRSTAGYVHMAVWRSQIINSAVKLLHDNKPHAAISVLTDRVTDGNEILKELAMEVGDEQK